jgi:hypothetical protein
VAGSAYYPSSAFGYWRGAGADGTQWKGQGSGMGPSVQGVGKFMQGQGAPGGGGGWEPTVIYLLLLIVAEMFVFGVLSRVLR